MQDGESSTEHGKGGEKGREIKNVPALADPILVFMESPAYVELLETVPSWKVVHVATIAEFVERLKDRKYSMLIALSPHDESGAAGKAIEAFRVENPNALTVYHGWDYRLKVSGPKAAKCQADALIVGGVEGGDLICFLGTALLCKSRGISEPSQQFYEKLLRLTCEHSPFWQLQDKPLPVGDID